MLVTSCNLQVGVGDNINLAVSLKSTFCLRKASKSQTWFQKWLLILGAWKVLHYEEVLKNPLSWSLWKCEKLVILMQKALVGLYSLTILNPSQSALFTESILD